VDDSQRLLLKSTLTSDKISAEYDLINVSGQVIGELQPTGAAFSVTHGQKYVGGTCNWWLGRDGTYGLMVKANSSIPWASKAGGLDI